MRLLQAAIVALAAVVPLGLTADAAELLMYRREDCRWCRAWDRDVGPGYGKTDIGRMVPVRMVDVNGKRPQIALKGPILYTPTFVLVENDKEIGRIEGYPGDSFFWGLLDRLVQQLPVGN
jgi:thioredoxin-related protein